MSSLKIYNTLSRKNEAFVPIKGKDVKLFVCGPTVYDFAHLGHAKTYINFDVIVRYLRFKNYKVFYLQNITDIDDKIITRAQKEDLGKNGWKIVKDKYEKLYKEDMKSLNVVSVNKYAAATDYIKEIVSQVKRLIDKGYAYKISDGWYFDLSKDKDYGKLSRRKISKKGDSFSRIDENKEKRNSGDFCLWKFSKHDEPLWKSEIGDGRPGWHIEDTAITEKEFGSQYDIHGGGVDLIFPHHEAEIAQMESISGKIPLVRYWLHTGFLEINNEKMGKSKKNFYTIKEILEKDYSGVHLRYFFLSAHYRKPLNFTLENLEAAKNAYERLKNILSELKTSKEKKNQKNIEDVHEQFKNIINDDFNMPKGLSFLWDILRDEKLNDSEKYELALKFDEVFGLDLGKEEKTSVPTEVKKLIAQREASRKAKDFVTSDKVREKINKLGFIIEDKEKGFTVKKK